MAERYSLIGIDGNAYSILGYVRKAMRRERYTPEEIEAYTKDATSSDYNNLLAITQVMIDKLNERNE